MTGFEDRGVLVTGASQGLGRAIFGELARAGARVVGVARGAAALSAAAEELRRAGYDAHALAADVGDVHAIYPLAGSAQALVGPIDVLVHDASTLGPTPLRPLLDTECEDFSRVLEVNLLGPFRLTRAIVGGMIVRGRGIVASISSDAAINAYPSWGPYGASKAALDHLTRTWAAELEGTGVIAVSIDPGEMDTEMHRAALPDADPATLDSPATVGASIAAGLRGLTPRDNGRRVLASEWRAR